MMPVATPMASNGQAQQPCVIDSDDEGNDGPLPASQGAIQPEVSKQPSCPDLDPAEDSQAPLRNRDSIEGPAFEDLRNPDSVEGAAFEDLRNPDSLEGAAFEDQGMPMASQDKPEATQELLVIESDDEVPPAQPEHPLTTFQYASEHAPAFPGEPAKTAPNELPFRRSNTSCSMDVPQPAALQRLGTESDAASGMREGCSTSSLEKLMVSMSLEDTEVG